MQYLNDYEVDKESNGKERFTIYFTAGLQQEICWSNS